MQILLTAVVLAAAAAFLAFAIAGCGSGTRTPEPKSSTSPAAAPEPAKQGASPAGPGPGDPPGAQPAAKAEPGGPVPGPAAIARTRADLKAMLEELARREPPKDLNLGAMCYDMKAPPDRVDYVCPACGERTLYALRPAEGERKADFGLIQAVLQDVPNCRRLVRGIRGVALKLDESRFCAKCAPGAAEPELGLVVTHAEDGKERRTWGITSRDLLILDAFLKGEDKFKGAFDREEPVRDHRARIEQLLGLSD
jgi:hypothetical protein